MISANLGRVLELLINSKKTSTSILFEENVERVLCLWFSIIHAHYPNLKEGKKAWHVINIRRD